MTQIYNGNGNYEFHFDSGKKVNLSSAEIQEFKEHFHVQTQEEKDQEALDEKAREVFHGI